MITNCYIVLYILVVCIFRSPDWLAWTRKTYYSVNANTWFTPSHDSACSRNNHPTACLWGLFCCIVHWSTTGCVWYFSRFFSHSLKSQSKVWFCPLLFLHWYYWSFCVHSAPVPHQSDSTVWRLIRMHFIIWYSKHYWAAQEPVSEALNMWM